MEPARGKAQRRDVSRHGLSLTGSGGSARLRAMNLNDHNDEKREEGAMGRFFSLGLKNPVVRVFSWVLFVLLVVRLAYLGFPGLPVPAVGEKAAMFYTAPRAVICEQPNPNMDTLLERARDDVPAYYVVENSALVERRSQVKGARQKANQAIKKRRRISQGLETLQKGGAQGREGLFDSPFYHPEEGESPEGREATAPSSGREELTQTRDEIDRYLMGLIHSLVPAESQRAQERILQEMLRNPDLADFAFEVADQALEKIVQWYIVDKYSRYDRDRSRGILVVDGGGTRPLTGEDQVYAWEAALEALQQFVEGRLIRDSFPMLKANRTLSVFAVKLVRSSVRPNFRFDEDLTQSAFQEAEARVPRVIRKEFQQGQHIVALGEEVVPWQKNCIERLSLHRSGSVARVRVATIPLPTVLLILGTALLTLGLALLLKRFAAGSLAEQQLTGKDILAMGVLIVLHLALLRLYLFLASVVSVTYPELGRSVMLIAAPVAVAPMILNAILGVRIAVVGTLYLAPVTMVIGLLAGPEMMAGSFPVYYGLYVLTVSLTGVWVTRRVTRRGTYLLGGFVSANFGVVVWAVVLMLEGGQTSSSQVLQLAVGSLASGAVSYILLVSLVPIFEFVWDYTTDSRLLELGSTDHAALRELARSAPGTYQHSMWIAVLVEEAAEAIHANALLARVGAYYHDLGKLAVSRGKDLKSESSDSPLYFAENQTPGANPHDHLPPRISARLIKGHVAQSIRMIRRFRLGRKVMDIAAQHHGTTLLEHFYNKAVAESRDRGGVVDEKEFRYPGPRPQSREAALVMLADSVEAAVRALPQHTEEQISQRVRLVVQKRIDDGQLDDSTMTFGEVRRVEASFLKTLVSMYHARPEYLRPRPEESTVRLRREDIEEAEETRELRPLSVGEPALDPETPDSGPQPKEPR